MLISSGVFNDPEMSVCIGEKETIDLFNGYLDYLNEQKEGKDKIVSEVKPITGTWINLAYQDVRNKYVIITNILTILTLECGNRR